MGGRPIFQTTYYEQTFLSPDLGITKAVLYLPNNCLSNIFKQGIMEIWQDDILQTEYLTNTILIIITMKPKKECLNQE